jgi:hypothetical protein
MVLGYVEPPRSVRSLTRKKKSKDFRRRCALCGKPLSMTDRGDTLNLKGRTVVVHKKCKHDYFDKIIPKE